MMIKTMKQNLGKETYTKFKQNQPKATTATTAG